MLHKLTGFVDSSSYLHFPWEEAEQILPQFHSTLETKKDKMQDSSEAQRACELIQEGRGAMY